MDFFNSYIDNLGENLLEKDDANAEDFHQFCNGLEFEEEQKLA